VNEETIPKQVFPTVQENGAIDAISTVVPAKATSEGGIGIDVKFTVGCALTVPEKSPVLGATKNTAIALPVIVGAAANLSWAATRVDAGALVKGGN
jgi:hypothetical protein